MAKNEIPAGEAVPGKKTYIEPRLEVYGDLREVTQAVKNQGNADGGTSPKGKTH